MSDLRSPKRHSLLSKMWLGASSRAAGKYSSQGEYVDLLKEQLFVDLIQEAKCAAPSAQLSYTLRCRLERCDKEVRKAITLKKRDGCSPLFIACKKGNLEIAEYLITVCSADVEQRGLYEVPDDRSVHNVTPLWCAAVAGKVKIVELLVKYQADVNSVSDTGSTPVRSACFMTHVDIVKILVKSTADIQRPNYNGGTCLINSVQSVELCEFLLQNGANVNAQDIQKKTALHYAIQEHRFETTKLLLQYGANPHLASRYNDDALQTACLKGASEIFTYLIDHVEYSADRVSSAFELLGSTFLDEHHDSQKTLQYWRAACDIRQKYEISKEVLDESGHKFKLGNNNNNNIQDREFQNRFQLDSIALDLDSLRFQSLLICERILGTGHKDMIYRLMYRGAAYADSLQYQQCIDLWKYALELRIAKDSILFCDTCFTAQALVKLYLDLFEKSNQGVLQKGIKAEDVLSTIGLLARDLPEARELLKVTPKFRRQQESYDKVLKIITHLLHLLTRLDRDEETDLSMRRNVHRLLKHVAPVAGNGDTLLHLAVSRSNSLKTQNLFDDRQLAFFPSLAVTELLIDCGADLTAVNEAGDSALHVASSGANFRQEIVDRLLENGAHIDAKNRRTGVTPAQTLSLMGEKGASVKPLKFTTLQCLAAAEISKMGIEFENNIPKSLEEFVKTH